MKKQIMDKKKNIRRAGMITALILLLAGCGTQGKKTEDSGKPTEETAQETETDAEEAVQEAERDLFAMDTYMVLQAYGENAQAAVDAAADEVNRLDALLSTGDENSEVAQVNAGMTVTLSDDTAYLLERSLELYQDTNGAFDIAIYPVMQAWGFPTQEFTVPAQETLDALLPLTDAADISYDAQKKTIHFEKEDMQIDLGGIAKGYTSSRIMDIYRQYGITSGLVNLGGNVQVYGAKTDGSLWRIAIQSPDDESSYLGVLTAKDVAVITSGGYERYFEQDGVVYHHIIDPATGYPANNGLVSVTIVSADGTLADGLSTSLFIMGKEKAIAYWQEHSEEFDTILVDEDGMIYVTEGIADSFSTDMDMQIIERGEAK